MKIAISTDNNFVSSHFGRCPCFTIVEIEGQRLVNKTVIENPGHHPGFLPEFFRQRNVEAIVAGGMGPRAVDLFAEAGIKIMVGVEGRVDEVIEKILSRTLKGGESLCRPGEGRGYGVEKSECDHTDDLTE